MSWESFPTGSGTLWERVFTRPYPGDAVGVVPSCLVISPLICIVIVRRFGRRILVPQATPADGDQGVFQHPTITWPCLLTRETCSLSPQFWPIIARTTSSTDRPLHWSL